MTKKIKYLLKKTIKSFEALFKSYGSINTDQRIKSSHKTRKTRRLFSQRLGKHLILKLGSLVGKLKDFRMLKKTNLQDAASSKLGT